MTPEQKCVSLETAKKLRDAGFPQETERMHLFIPCNRGHEHWELVDPITTSLRRLDLRIVESHKISAPDAQEIGELLPDTLMYFKWNEITGKKWNVEFHTKEIAPADINFSGINEAEARAAAWLWLKEQKLI